MQRLTFLSGPRRQRAIVFAVALLGLVIAGESWAQGIGTGVRRGQRQFQPASPTLSPYLSLLQTNFGPVPNYFSLVRPQMDQRAFNRQVQATQRVRSLQIQRLSDELEQGVGNQPTQTGKHGGFMQFLHFYPPPGRSLSQPGRLTR